MKRRLISLGSGVHPLLRILLSQIQRGLGGVRAQIFQLKLRLISIGSGHLHHPQIRQSQNLKALGGAEIKIPLKMQKRISPGSGHLRHHQIRLNLKQRVLGGEETKILQFNLRNLPFGHFLQETAKKQLSQIKAPLQAQFDRGLEMAQKNKLANSKKK